MQIQVNLQSKLSKLRRELDDDGREHFVVHSYTLPSDVVMNGGLYPASEIDKHYQGLEGTLAPLGHPTVNGKFVSARSPEGINRGHIGAWNRNVRKVGNRVSVEKWIDIEVAKRTEQGRRLIDILERAERGEDVEPIHSSVAMFIEKQPASGKDYEWIAKIHEIDHDAILLDEPGAATPDDGVGLMVNVDQAQPIQGEFSDSFMNLHSLLTDAAKGLGWVADFNDSHVIIETDKGTMVYAYSKLEDGSVKLSSDAGKAIKKTTWLTKNPVVNVLKKFFTNSRARPDNDEESDMSLTPEEKAELLQGFGEIVTNEVGKLNERLNALEANQQQISAKLSEAEDKKEAEMRKAVAAEHGEVVANALSGDALKQMYEKLGDAAELKANRADDGGEFAPELEMPTFGGEK